MPRTTPLSALVVTNMYPTPARPEFGRFVADQVAALGRLDGVRVSVHAFSGGSPGAYARAAASAARRFRGQHYDVVHAHFGLSAWVGLAVRARIHGVTLHGSDLAHPRSRAITSAALPWLSLIGVASAELAAQVPAWAARSGVQVLPCGVDLTRFSPLPRAAACAALGLDPEVRYLLFPADPSRPEKRHDRARAAVEAALGSLPPSSRPRVRLLTLGGVEPRAVSSYINASDAVLIPSEREGFGLAVLEALACAVPVLATPHGIAPTALAGVPGCLCAAFDAAVWGTALSSCLTGKRLGEEIGSRAVAPFGADRLAARLLDSWRGLVELARVGDGADQPPFSGGPG